MGSKQYDLLQGNTDYGIGYQIKIPNVSGLNLGLLSDDKAILQALTSSGGSAWPAFADLNGFYNITEKGRVYAVPYGTQGTQYSNRWAYLMVRIADN